MEGNALSCASGGSMSGMCWW